MAVLTEDTIYALSSGAGRAAISVLRISGPRTRFVLETMAGLVPPARMAQVRSLRHPVTRQVLDRALVLFFAGPASETGEDVAEFQVHGGRAVVAGVLGALGSIDGLRVAEPGEFARRALLNGKMDLLAVEALGDLIDAETELQRQQAIEGGGSLLRDRADAWRDCLLDIRVDLEAELDFSDEADVSDHLDSHAEQSLRRLSDEMALVLDQADRGERIREGFRVVLLGPPNVGKSSLMNALAGRDVAIVSAIAGTTRDRIEVNLDLNGLPVVVTDTAGLQESQDEIEREGISRSLAAAASADLVLWITAADDRKPAPALVTRGVVREVVSKADLGSSSQPCWCAVSTRMQHGLESLLAAIEAEAQALLTAPEPAITTRLRHRSAIETAHAAVLRALTVSGRLELVAEEVRLACSALDRLIGRVDVEDILGGIFSRFCVGK